MIKLWNVLKPSNFLNHLDGHFCSGWNACEADSFKNLDKVISIYGTGLSMAVTELENSYLFVTIWKFFLLDKLHILTGMGG
ncbi:hypothetical protein FRX31_022976 [Thalictrum thalictroides]|uniref:Uncharacterized protein n=1 Tax=Thalictrum thalictroides TaxID=46969 RepID=A0A7J6VTC8_THATH|nr:hypothetical protein FRX31_022976 [Thalictrum thalictroides]